MGGWQVFPSASSMHGLSSGNSADFRFCGGHLVRFLYGSCYLHSAENYFA
jgi:hypothetical protein